MICETHTKYTWGGTNPVKLSVILALILNSFENIQIERFFFNHNIITLFSLFIIRIMMMNITECFCDSSQSLYKFSMNVFGPYHRSNLFIFKYKIVWWLDWHTNGIKLLDNSIVEFGKVLLQGSLSGQIS